MASINNIKFWSFKAEWSLVSDSFVASFVKALVDLLKVFNYKIYCL